MSLAQRWAEERSNFRALGAFNGTLYLLHRILERISGSRLRLVRYVLVVQPVTAPAPARPRPSRIEIVELAAGDPRLTLGPRTAEAVQARFARQGHCLAAFDEGRFAAWAWYQLSPYAEDEVRCDYRCLPEGRTSWDYDVLIEDRYRLSPLFARLWQAGNAMLHRLGIAWTASRISAFNSMSLRSHARLGALRVGTVTFLCIGRWQLMIGTCAPHVHLSTGRSRPAIEVDARKGRALR